MRAVSRLDRKSMYGRQKVRIAAPDRTGGVSSSLKSAFQFFEPKSFRPGQREAIEQIEAAFESGSRVVILEAPTGLGKSHVARAFAMQSGECHILTVQKVLQDQYARDFSKDMFVMKGRNAYMCLKANEEGKPQSCAEGPCRRSKKKPACYEECPYLRALHEAVDSPIVVHNFDSFYYQTSFARSFISRDLLIVDEAHGIESKFLNFVEFTISNKHNHSLTIPKYNCLSQYDDFLNERLKWVSKALASYDDDLKEMMSIEDLKKTEELTRLKTRLELYFKTRGKSAEYVFDWVDHKMYQTLTLRPVLVGNFVKERLLQFGGRILFMSATILDKNLFCESIGISPKEAAFIEVDSCFPVENRPIHRVYAGSMSYRNINNSLPKMIVAVEALLQKHPDDRGIIHTVSEKIANYIKYNCSDPRLTFRKDYRTVVDALKVHEEKPNSVLVASGLREGLDLAGDLSRVQLIAKVPYPSLGDKRVQRRKELNPAWYGYMTTLMFIQSLGRSVRSATDYAVTYILDKDFDLFYKMNKQFIPKYIRRAIVSKGA